MRILIVALLFVLGFQSTTFAQKYAYVDTEYILSKIPEYKEAQNLIDEMSKGWQDEIENKYKQIERKQQEFQAEAILLPDEMKQKRKEEIMKLQKEARALQSERFGVKGDLFKKREELIKPIQDRVFDAIQQLASEQNYAFIFDKANQSNLLYGDSKYDKSDQVLRKMGINPKSDD